MEKDDICGQQTEKIRKEYLLPSIRLPGRGLPLKMAAAFPEQRVRKIEKKGEKPRGEERYS